MPVLVDFWAPSCAPCFIIDRLLEAQEAAFAGRLLMVKVNADESPETAAAYGVRGLPTLILLKGGKPIDTKVGALSSAKIKALLDAWAAA